MATLTLSTSSIYESATLHLIGTFCKKHHIKIEIDCDETTFVGTQKDLADLITAKDGLDAPYSTDLSGQKIKG